MPWWLGWQEEGGLIFEARYPDDSIPLLRFSIEWKYSNHSVRAQAIALRTVPEN